jgi:hypothetical protein
VQKIPPRDQVEEKVYTVKTFSTPEGRILSLDDGAHYFAESRKVKKEVKKTLLRDVVDNFNLPKDIVDRLRGSDGK